MKRCMVMSKGYRSSSHWTYKDVDVFQTVLICAPRARSVGNVRHRLMGDSSVVCFWKTEHLCLFTAPSLWMNLCEVNKCDDGSLSSGTGDTECAQWSLLLEAANML